MKEAVMATTSFNTERSRRIILAALAIVGAALGIVGWFRYFT
jgi:hypothetical protein